MRKFKVGDEVVVINWDILPSHRNLQIGESFIISTVSNFKDSEGRCSQCCYPKGQAGFFNSELELSLIFDTPLYNALK